MQDNNDIWEDLKAATTSYKSQHFQDAIQYCDKVIGTPSLSPSAAAQAWNTKAAACHSLGKYEEAVFCWKQYAIPDGFVKTWGNKAHAHFKLKQYDAALQYYAKLSQLSEEQKKNKVECLLGRSQEFLCQRQFPQARIYALTALAIDPTNTYAKQQDDIVRTCEEIDARKKIATHPFWGSLPSSSSTSDRDLNTRESKHIKTEKAFHFRKFC